MTSAAISPSPARPSFAGEGTTGWIALVATVLIWASFALSIRAVGATSLTPGDAALIRFLVPALAMLPFMPSRLAALRAMRASHALMIAVGGGLPFFLLAMAGGRLTTAAHVSALIAGTVPLSVAILGFALYRERLAAWRAMALGIIIGGILLLVAGLGAFRLDMVGGAALLLSASLLWGLYTLGLRHARIDPIACVMLVTYPSLAGVALLMATGALDSNLAHASLRDVAIFAAIQGVCVGFVSVLAYSVAVRRLGALRCATVGALAPVLAALLAVPLLGEIPSMLSLAGVAVVTAGVLLSSRPARETR